MLFPTGIFAIFFALVFLGHWSLVRFRPAFDRPFLLAANLVFYAFWSLEFCAALLLVGLWTWGIGLLAGRRRSRPWLWLGIAGALAWLFYFKYANFFLVEVLARLDGLGLGPMPLLDIVLPVGISFYVFQAISYMVDAHEGAAEPEPSPLNVLVYLTFFPHLAAGPIVRAAHFLPQLHTPPDRFRIPVVMACILILGGLFKKMVIASELATGIVDPVFRDPSAHGALDILLAAYGYSIQIFCDFSAYSDMAIGFAALLGYHFPKNFDQPFRALSLSEFWRRWHISLSSWLRDYVYIRCFGGNRRRAGFALMATMVLGGIWHGAAWNFVLWGLLHGVALWVERALGGKATPAGRGARLLRWVITFHIVVIGFVLFRAHDLAGFGAMLGGVFNLDAPNESVTWRLLALALLGLSFHVWPADLRQRIEALLRRLPPVLLGLLVGVALLLILLAGPEGVAPFIYFQF
ncbi:MBOAT family O-acyltransferase [Sediminicoccus sp. KRV36]|uniref:MBOAT family O-acyltransferase n=1 Tax=Sediminicoccus sp. KRV36 TaxID=3133721 RepID=UPI002010161B|nr:MBOAT family O-acyltransferase [Sediminicoccus rosea]UPY36314.1 MBOAT family protein [Sediminicoccus rosea]